MKHVFKIATLSLLCANAYATPIYHPAGPNLTYGAVSNNQSIISNVTNPAAGAAVFTKEDSQYRFGILSSVGFGYEFGKVDDLYTEIDTTQQQLTTTQQLDYLTVCPPPITTTQCGLNIAAYLNTNVISNINTVSSSLQADANVSAFFSGHVPIMPLVISHKGLGGSFVLDVNGSTIANMTFFDDPIADITGAQAEALVTGGTISGDQLNYNLDDLTAIANTDSILIVKAAAIAELALGYSRPVFKTDAGELMAGLRAKYYMVSLSRTAQRLMSSDGAESTFDASNDYTKSSGLGLDAGALWISTNYRAGVWIDNINKPSFKYNDIDTTGYTDAAVIATLSKDAKYEMETQAHLEGAVYTESQNWVVNVGLDANAVSDPVGNEFQWATLSAGYATDSWWIPGFRVGYRTNMAGSELSYLTTGLTAFKSVTLDLAYSLDSVTIEGETAPRSVIFNLGVELSF